jgi:outer membrane protein assembly factor BamE (lipoprotein component of BamABCDE complex)
MTASTPLIPVTKTRSLTPVCARVVAFIVAATSLVLLSSSSAPAQRKAATPAVEEELSAFKDYRGVQLGMTADEVRKKLGSPKDKGDEQDFYVFSDNETAQIVYDLTHKVITISADYLSTEASVPTCKQVLGTEAEAKADGSVYKMVRFPKAGYWLSYNRTGGTSPMTSITLQKIQ